MKRVVLEVPDNVDVSEIFYWSGLQYVRANVVEKFPIQLNVALSDEEIEKVNKHIKETMRKSAVMVFPNTPASPPSRKEFEALCTRVQRLELLTTSYQPSAEEGLRIVGCSDKEIEEIRSRVEKLERESERQCARVIKMEEGISDDLK